MKKATKGKFSLTLTWAYKNKIKIRMHNYTIFKIRTFSKTTYNIQFIESSLQILKNVYTFIRLFLLHMLHYIIEFKIFQCVISEDGSRYRIYIWNMNRMSLYTRLIRYYLWPTALKLIHIITFGEYILHMSSRLWKKHHIRYL